MQAREIRELSEAELGDKESELREEVVRLRLRKGLGQLTSPARLRSARRDLARVLTVRDERAREAKGS